MLSMVSMLGGWGGVATLVVLAAIVFFTRHFVGGMFGLYRIVPVNEAHIRVLGNKKAVFSSRSGLSAYWYVPFMTKLHKLPLCNLAIPVSDIKLNDKDMAKFICDIMCFVNIKDVNLAVERLVLTDTSEEMGFDFQKLSVDLCAIMESVGRTVATKQTILDIYRDRGALDKAITAEVENVFPKWGIELVDLELKDIKDAQDSTIIHDIEMLRAAEIRRDAEIRVAETSRDAAIKTAEAKQQSEIAVAKSEEAFRKQQIEKDRQVALAEQKKNEEIALAQAKVNVQQVAAKREVEVGQAEIARQAAEKTAEARKIVLSVEAEGESNKILTIGKAEADVVRLKKEADAAGTEKLAEAMKKFDDKALNVKLLDIQKDVVIAKYAALSAAVGKADIKWIMSGDNAQKFFGMNLNAEGGANLEQFLQESGISLDKVKSMVAEMAKKASGK